MFAASLIMQWNACGITSHASELKNYLFKCNKLPDVICVQETFLKPNKMFKIDKYDIIRKDRVEQAKGGLITFVRTGISYRVIDSPVNVECVIIETSFRKSKTIIINVYNPPDKEIDVSAYRELFSFKNCVIIGDFNAKSALWKHADTNQRGRIIEQLIDEFQFKVMNTGEQTYQCHRGGMSSLDLSMVSKEIAAKCSWAVINDSLGSDH